MTCPAYLHFINIVYKKDKCTIKIFNFFFKVIVYAGPGIQGKKVIEYGGNSFGYGSRSVLGNGWPKDLVKVKTIAYFELGTPVSHAHVFSFISVSLFLF